MLFWGFVCEFSQGKPALSFPQNCFNIPGADSSVWRAHARRAAFQKNQPKHSNERSLSHLHRIHLRQHAGPRMASSPR
jgi:hypothetical protein